MAIYRIKSKLFTRAEKEMIKQIWRKTKGLRELPGGITNLEDARALKDLSRQLDNRDVPVKITPEIRKALDNLGFTKTTEDTINRVRAKYDVRNGEAHFRLRRIKDRHRPTDPSTAVKNAHSMQRRMNQTNRLAENAGEDFCRLTQQASQNTVDPSLTRFYRKKLNGTAIKIDDPTEALSMSRLRDDFPEVTLKGARENSVHPVKAKDLKGINRPGGEMIAVGDRSPRAITLHEMGHNKSAREFGAYGKTPSYHFSYRGPTTIMGEDGVHKIAEENMASANALHVLRNQKGVEKDKELLDKAMSTYTLGLRSKLKR